MAHTDAHPPARQHSQDIYPLTPLSEHQSHHSHGPRPSLQIDATKRADSPRPLTPPGTGPSAHLTHEQPDRQWQERQRGLVPNTHSIASVTCTLSGDPNANPPLQPLDLNHVACNLTVQFALNPSAETITMHVVRTWNACVTGTYAKAWLIEHFTMACNAAADCLRLEVLELWNLGTLIDSARGDLVFLENAAEVFVTSKWMPINLLAMFVKGDQKIRWFYSVISMASLFRWLDHDGLLEETTKKMNTTTAKGKRLYKFMQEYFLKAMQIPHHPDFSAAERLTDYAQHIFSPETAQRRLEACLEYHDLQPRNIPDIDPKPTATLRTRIARSSR